MTPDPGQYHVYKPFDSGAKSFRIGDQYRPKSPGAQSAKTCTRSRSTFITDPVNHYQLPRDGSPDPGDYQPDLRFSSKSCLGTLRVKGRDPLWKVDDNPNNGPGKYNHTESEWVTKKRVSGGLIKPTPQRLWVKPQE